MLPLPSHTPSLFRAAASALRQPTTFLSTIFQASTAVTPPATLPSNLTQLRTFKKHTWDSDHIGGTGTRSRGRSVVVGNRGPTEAYFQLRRILDESDARGLVRYQSRFERKHDKKRRKRREKEFKLFLGHIKTEVKKAFDLKNRSQIDAKQYKEI
ncbi:hypothetical protein HK097_001968 [Rhizophlyctis rosea]|uniref:Ribosomal protein S21 n=1 Tax=Rhizophlyctis rosea TaxID=64517 RepID=A0AAD5S402_9FUNG|nr:hypothetical protein HK097_001968 [Rhizophlyctis rosea]